MRDSPSQGQIAEAIQLTISKHLTKLGGVPRLVWYAFCSNPSLWDESDVAKNWLLDVDLHGIRSGEENLKRNDVEGFLNWEQRSDRRMR